MPCSLHQPLKHWPSLCTEIIVADTMAIGLNDHWPQETLQIALLENPKVSLLFGYLLLSHEARWRLYPACSWGQCTASCFSAKLISNSKVRAASSPVIAWSSRIAFSCHRGHPCLLTFWQPWKPYQLFRISTWSATLGPTMPSCVGGLCWDVKEDYILPLPRSCARVFQHQFIQNIIDIIILFLIRWHFSPNTPLIMISSSFS